MYRTFQVLLTIAIVASAVQVFALVVDYTEPRIIEITEYSENQSARSELRWKVYWFSGLALAVVGYLAKRRFELAGLAWFIAGIYLMILGNNAGFWATGFVGPRLVTSVLTFLGLTALVLKERWEKVA